MRICKYSFLGSGKSSAVFVLILSSLIEPAVSSIVILPSVRMNCSQTCDCQNKALGITMSMYNERHFEIIGDRYRFFHKESGDIFSAMSNQIAEITCILSDGLSHSVMSLLNGVDQFMDTALNVSCKRNEHLIWDVSWRTSFNIFVSENCLIVPGAEEKSIVVPMNMWILDVENGGHSTLGLLDIRFSKNILNLVIKGSSLPAIPYQWYNISMGSLAVISLQDNGIEEFNCPFQYTQRLDTLNLNSNKIDHFPECLLHSYKMRVNHLSLANNAISDLAPLYEVPEASDASDISVINLSFNQIRSVDAIRNMANLEVLDLSHNNITYITEDAFDYLTSLVIIFISHNRIHTIGAHQFTNNHKLILIDISYNVLTVISPGQLPQNSSYLVLDVRQNSLLYPPYIDCAKNKLNMLNIEILSSGNPFTCDCYMIQFEKCQKWITENRDHPQEVQSVFIDLMNLTCNSPKETKGVALPKISFQYKCTMIQDCPQSCKCMLLKMETLVVNCSARHLFDMPDHLPEYPNTRVVLHLDHNPLKILGHRPYLRDLSELHVDNCLLTSVTPAAIALLRDVRVLTLHNNRLQKLPSTTCNITLTHAKNVTLHNNPWACSCDSLWLPSWITKHEPAIWMPASITCHYLRKPVEELTEMDLICNSYDEKLDTFLAISLPLTFLVSPLVIVFCYRSEITMLLYSKLGFRLSCGFSLGDLSPYDAFVSYSQDTYNWVMDTLVPQLEKGPKKYRLCLHYRDISTGDSLADSLPWSIRVSRCAILVLSKDVTKKEWRILEIRAVFQRMLLMANKLVIITVDNVCTDELPPDMRTYMNMHDYLRFDDPCFWDKLEMLLPPKEHTEEVENYHTTPLSRSRDSFQQSTPEKHEMTGGSDVTDLSFKLSEISEHAE